MGGGSIMVWACMS
jgi:hypothetical protein